MTDVREFRQTKVMIFYGYIFWHQYKKGPLSIGFLRRPQLDGVISPWIMATAGGMRSKTKVLDKDGGLTTEGFMGRPPSGDEIAQMHLQIKLGVKIDAEFYVPPLEGWLEVTYPFFSTNSASTVRHVGILKRKVRQIEGDDIRILREAMASRNAMVEHEYRNEVEFFTLEDFDQMVLGGNHSLKAGEIELLRTLYGVLADKDQFHFQAEAHLAVAD